MLWLGSCNMVVYSYSTLLWVLLSSEDVCIGLFLLCWLLAFL